jgi:cytochrome c5
VTRVLLLALVLAAAGAAGTGAEEITLPPDHPYGTLKPGPGSEVAQRSCVLCHSTDYIVRQPPGDAKQWDGVVTKMIKAFGAPLSEADAKTITEYLTRQYGK